MGKITYEQRVLEMAEKMTINNYDKSAFLPDDKWATLDDYGKEVAIYSMVDNAKISVAAQAEAIIEQLQPYRSNGFIDKLLIDNGYKPSPEILKMEVPVNYKCPDCHNEYMVDDTGTYCDNYKCSRFWDTKL